MQKVLWSRRRISSESVPTAFPPLLTPTPELFIILGMEEHLILLEGCEGEIVEKKSRFIATMRPVTTEEDARSFIEEMKKKYWDARHNCFAYCIGESSQLQRFSDDGEPGGTAGKPILEVLTGSQVRNLCCVVTRYFGGVLLGTGGLVRAYTAATQEALKNARIARRIPGVVMDIKVSYTDVGKVLYYLEENHISQEDSVYAEDVTLTVLIAQDMAQALQKALTESTSGRARITEVGQREYNAPLIS